MTRHLLGMAMLLATIGLLAGCARQTTPNTGSPRVAGTQESAGSATISIADDQLSTSPASVSMNDGTITVTNTDKTAKTFTIMGIGRNGKSQQFSIQPGQKFMLRIRKTSANHYEVSMPKPVGGGKAGSAGSTSRSGR